MNNYIIIIIALCLLIFSASKNNILIKTSGLFASFCLIASLIYPDINELFIVAINGFFVFMLTAISYKKYEKGQNK